MHAHMVRGMSEGGSFAVRSGPGSTELRSASTDAPPVGKRTLIPQAHKIAAPAPTSPWEPPRAEPGAVGTSRDGHSGHDVLALFGRPASSSEPGAQAPAPSLQLGHGAAKPTANAKTNATASSGLGAWAGAGTAGKVFRNTTAETFVDPASKEAVEVETSWMLAEYDQLEIQTNTAMEVERRIHIQLARGGVVIKSRVRAFFNADQLPNDVHAALHAPARLLKHDGVIFVTDDKGVHLLKSFDHPMLDEPSAAALLAHQPMLGYETEPQQRIREADKFVTATVPTYDNNMLLVESIMRDAPHAAMGLKNYIKTTLSYETPSPEALSIARHMIAGIEELLQFSWTGYEGTDLMFQLGEMQGGFHKLVAAAEAAKPEEKQFLDHASDLVRAISNASVGVVLAVKEVGLMARDLGMWGIDKLANAFDYEIDWSAASSIGKAYESGKSTSEIFRAMLDGIIASWTNAIEHAENGDYSRLMDLGAELALDIAIEVATAGAATAGVAAKRTGAAARRADHALVLAEDALNTLTQRVETVLERAKQMLARAPEEARAALLDTIDTASGWLTGLKESVRVADAGVGTMRIVDKTAIATAIQRSHGARAIDTAKDAMRKLRGGTARAQGASVIEQLKQLAKASKMPDTIYAIARRIAEGENKAKFVGALDKLLKGTAKALDEEVVTGVLWRAADALDPLAFLDNVEWLMGRKGLTTEARKALARQAVLRDSPLDLRWLRELTDLPDNMLEFMAHDPATNWRTFMKVSKKPSDYFPSSLKKSLKNSDYADAAAKLRGVAGEMMFVVEGVELPGGLKIVARQVDAAGKVIDFGLRDASGALAKLEVKAWTAERWANELVAVRAHKPKTAFTHMIEQLTAAKSSGQPVYLAVSDAIGTRRRALADALSDARLPDVKIVTFPETKLREISSTLRKGLGLSAATTTVAADQIAKGEDDD